MGFLDTIKNTPSYVGKSASYVGKTASNLYKHTADVVSASTRTGLNVISDKQCNKHIDSTTCVANGVKNNCFWDQSLKSCHSCNVLSRENCIGVCQLNNNNKCVLKQNK